MLLTNLSSWLPQSFIRRGGCTAVVVLAVLASGCGSTNTNSQSSVGTSPGSSTVSGLSDSTATNGDDNPAASSANSEDQTPGTTSTRRPATTTTLYDTDEYFEVTFDFQDYICENRSLWGEQYDCVRYFGGRAPFIFTPDLYCSGPEFNLSCSFTWYPDELDGYEFITVNYNEYVCEDTWRGGGDKDCYRYNGGDPSRSTSGWVDLYCSESGYSLTCDTDEYPSVLEAAAAEWEDYVILTIDRNDYICNEKSYIFEIPCVRYFGGSPSGYWFMTPDYRCRSNGFIPAGYRCEPA